MNFLRRALTLGLMVSLIPASAMAQRMVPSTAPVTHGEFPVVLREVLLKNPDILMDALRELQQKHREETGEADVEKGLQKHKMALIGDENQPSIGASMTTADVTVVEFFDYHCGYCKHMVEPIDRILAEDKKVRFIFIEFPILSQDSTAAARAALAVNRMDPTKYYAFHSALMKSTGKFDAPLLERVAKEVGINYEQLRAEMAKKEITTMLENNRKIAEDLGIRGTPALIVGGQLLPGALAYPELKSYIEQARKKQR